VESAGLWMLALVAIILPASGLPSWIVLIGVSLIFSIIGVIADIFPISWLNALPQRVIGLLEHDLLQALPLYVFVGTLLNRLPLAQTVFLVSKRTLSRTGAGASLSGLLLGALLAPMCGSVGGSAAMLTRTVNPLLQAEGIATAKSAALLATSSTFGVVVPPSLVLILLGDAMLRAHTEAVNATHEAVRIINTQDVFRGALLPAGLLFALQLLLVWRTMRTAAVGIVQPASNFSERMTAIATVLFVLGLLAGVALGYLYAVEAAATGAVVLFIYGLFSKTLNSEILANVLGETMAVTGALFALLIAATVFTMVLRAFETDRWVTTFLAGVGGSFYRPLLIVMCVLALCALVLDAFEMIFAVIPIVMPPLLMRVPNAAWAAVLTLLILQTSFLIPHVGYAVLVVRNRMAIPIDQAQFTKALWPYVLLQLAVVSLVLIFPGLILRV
jgi:tripartite ATP-independent transporter DctM subunit